MNSRESLAAAPSRKLPARYNAVVMPFLLSIFMSCIVAGISTVKSVGFTDGVLLKWLTAWGMSWAVAFPSLFVVMPVVRRITAAIVQQPGK